MNYNYTYTKQAAQQELIALVLVIVVLLVGEYEVKNKCALYARRARAAVQLLPTRVRIMRMQVAR